MKFILVQLILIYLASEQHHTALSFVIKTLITPCLNSSASVWFSNQTVRSLIDCYWKTRIPSAALQSIGVVHFHSKNLTCALFRYRDICHLLNMKNQQQLQLISQQQQQQQECESAVVESKYDLVTANAYFSAVWTSSNGGAFENIVCGADGVRNQLTATNVIWTPDGAQMNGVNSKMLVTDSFGFNFSKEVTMLLELKRTPKSQLQAFMELSDCSVTEWTSHADMRCHLWELWVIGQLTFNSVCKFTTRSTPGLLTNDPNEFFKFGVVHDFLVNRTKVFYGSSFLPETSLIRNEEMFYVVPGANCVKIGYRNSNTGEGVLNGTVKMAAIAGAFLPDDVVLSFMSGN